MAAASPAFKPRDPCPRCGGEGTVDVQMGESRAGCHELDPPLPRFEAQRCEACAGSGFRRETWPEIFSRWAGTLDLMRGQMQGMREAAQQKGPPSAEDLGVVLETMERRLRWVAIELRDAEEAWEE